MVVSGRKPQVQVIGGLDVAHCWPNAGDVFRVILAAHRLCTVCASNTMYFCYRLSPFDEVFEK